MKGLRLSGSLTQPDAQRDRRRPATAKPTRRPAPVTSPPPRPASKTAAPASASTRQPAVRILSCDGSLTTSSPPPEPIRAVTAAPAWAPGGTVAAPRRRGQSSGQVAVRGTGEAAAVCSAVEEAACRPSGWQPAGARPAAREEKPGRDPEVPARLSGPESVSGAGSILEGRPGPSPRPRNLRSAAGPPIRGIVHIFRSEAILFSIDWRAAGDPPATGSPPACILRP